MQAKHQAKALEQLMQRHHGMMNYTVSLPLVALKRGRVDTLKKGDVILTEFETLEFVLLDIDKTPCAKAILISADELEITELLTEGVDSCDESGEVLVYAVGTVYLSTMKAGQAIQNVSLRFDAVQIANAVQTIAAGSLVWVDGRLNILVSEVMQ